jgi:hypothetical protein
MRYSGQLLVSLLLLACGGGAQPAARVPSGAKGAAGPDVQVERVPASTSAKTDATRLGLAILVGPENEPSIFRDQRRLTLGRGAVRVNLRGVPSDLDTGQVTVRSLTAGAKLELVEFRAYTAALTPRGLLEPYLGKEVTAYLWDEPSKRDVARQATLLGLSPEGPIVAIDNETRALSFGRVAVPKLPDSARAEPTVELLLSSDRDVQDVELTYGSKQLKGAMVYQVVRAPGAAAAQLVGLVGLLNENETPVPEAMVSLTSESTAPTQFGTPGKEADSLTTFVRMPTAVALGGGEKAMVRLFGPTEATLARKVVLEGPGFPVDGGPEEYGNTSVRAVLDAAVASVLSPSGMIPGTAHLFERIGTEPPRAYGTAGARPLPGARGLRVDLGSEDKYPTKRRMLSKKNLGRCTFETSWDVTVSNPTEEALPIEDVEPVSGKYEVLDSSTPAIAKERDHFAFAVTVPATGEVHIKFRVRTSSCVTVRRRYWQPSFGKPWGSPSKSGS